MTTLRKCIALFSLLALAFLTLGCKDEITKEQHSISVVTPDPNDHSEEVNAILKRLTFLDGTTVEGVSIGGMTMDQAKTALASVVEQGKQSFSVLLEFGEESIPYSGEQVNVVCDLDAVLEEAFGLLREDIGYDALIAEQNDIRQNGKAYTLTYAFEESAARAVASILASERDVAATDASIVFDSETNKIAYTDEQAGLSIDQEALTASLLTAKSGDILTVPTVETAPVMTRATLEETFVLRATFTTSFKGSTNNRKYNIRKGAEMMTGTVLNPGDVFSCNDTLGVRTKKNGWKEAGAYIGGVTEDQAGGGVCQLSSTLYNCVVMSDLEIVDRRNHSMPVSYVKKGLDATINSVGNIIDFKFRNNTEDKIILISYTDGNNLTMEIYGLDFRNDEYDEIRLRAEKVKTLKPSGDMEYELDPNLPTGHEEVVQERRNGSIYKSYKQYYKNGELVREEFLAESTYRAYNGITRVGPSPSPTPVVTPGPATPPPEDPTEKPNDPTDAPADPPSDSENP